VLTRGVPGRLRLVTGVIVLTGLLILPLSAFGAKGAQLSAEVEALVAAVSPGEPMAFTASFSNEGASPLTHFRFDGYAPGATFTGATAPCTGSGATTSCELGTLAAGGHVALSFQFSAPETAAELRFTGVFSGDASQGNPNSAKIDTWAGNAQVTVSDSTDFFGRWQAPHGQHTFPTVGRRSHQLTTVVVPPVDYAYAALIGHTDDPIVCGASTIAGFGQTVELSIADGNSPIVVEISYSASAAAGNTPGQVDVVHQDNDGVCWFPPRGCKQNPGFCFDSSWSGAGQNRRVDVHIELPSNGSVKGF
jgi:hypothetical protein